MMKQPVLPGGHGVLALAPSFRGAGGVNCACVQVRLMRACRVIRLFGRFPELKKMVTAVSASILAMMHSFFIFILVMAICEPPPCGPAFFGPGCCVRAPLRALMR